MDHAEKGDHKPVTAEASLRKACLDFKEKLLFAI